MSRGRPAKGPKLVEDLSGSGDAKKRARVILQTISGEKGIDEACAELGIGKSAFHELRSKALQTMVADLESRPAGRPRIEVPEEQGEIDRLKKENQELLSKLEIAHVREELMLAMPEVFDPSKEKKRTSSAETKKKTEKKRQRKKRREMKKKSRKR
jgi:hypothetical protein